MDQVSVRQRSIRDISDCVPVHVVWEITLACNLKCQHCGSRAGKVRQDELSTEECFDVIDQFAALGTREVSLIGGEAYLRKDWTQIVRRIHDHGIRVLMQSGGRMLTERRLQEGRDAGLAGIGISLDGMESLHDRLRGVKGSWRDGMNALRTAKALGMSISCNTQLGSEIQDQLEPLQEAILDVGVTHWQIQLTVAMGNAVDNPEVLLQPYQLGELYPLLDRLSDKGRSRGLLMTMGNNVGYYGPFEHKWRGFGDDEIHWSGCAAGRNVIGIEADGSMKGCPSLATDGFSGGTVRERSVAEIWNEAPELHFGRLRGVEDLWGFCGTCYYADACRAGCTWTGHSLFGKTGNNPYCHHRVLELEKRGVRERVVKVEDAPQESFAIGRFSLVEEPIPGRTVTPAPPPKKLHTIEKGHVLARLEPCRACQHYIWPEETECPWCSSDVVVARTRYEREKAERLALIREVEDLLQSIGAMGLGQESRA